MNLLLWIRVLKFLILGYNLGEANDYIIRVDRVLKHALNLDRYEKPTPFEVTIDETPKETEAKTQESESTNTNAEQENKESADSL